ncbi:MAG: hypothetical protein N2Z81_00490 [Hydrogenothermaceae bacterium]|nr:hypothetical protein [Hydrogenothermaceae bacterium]
MVFSCNKIDENIKKSQSGSQNRFLVKSFLQRSNMLDILIKEYKTTQNQERQKEILKNIKLLYKELSGKLKNLEEANLKISIHQFLCNIGDMEALSISKRAQELYNCWISVDLLDEKGEVLPLYFGKTLPNVVNAKIGDIKQLESLKEIFKIIGRYKPSRFFGETLTSINYAIGNF